MLGKALYDLLSTDAGVSALVSTRIFPAIMEQGVTMPALCYTIIGGTKVAALTQDTDIAETLVQIDCYAETYPAVRDLHQAVLTALQRYEGTNAGIVIDDIVVEDEQDIREEDTKLFRTSVDYLVRFRE